MYQILKQTIKVTPTLKMQIIVVGDLNQFINKISKLMAKYNIEQYKQNSIE